MLGAGFYILRLATRDPDVSWNRKKNPEPWEEYRNKQYKVNIPLHWFPESPKFSFEKKNEKSIEKRTRKFHF
jgi:hypothetical protein